MTNKIYNNIPLIVDLDGTLIQSDLLLETLSISLKESFFKTIFFFIKNINDFALIKHFLAEKSKIKINNMPFNKKVLNFIKDRKKKGSPIILMTGSNIKLALKIQEHLNLFDNVYASDKNNNLVGKAKLQLILEKFGEFNYDYMADAKSDIEVWKYARKIITVNSTKSIKRKVENLSSKSIHLGETNWNIKKLYKLLRCYQWSKNLLIFLPILLAQDASFFSMSPIYAFTSFCLIASANYIINDFFDIESDRQNRKSRLFALGEIDIKKSLYFATIIMFLGFLIASLSQSTSFFILLVIYAIVSLVYSVFLKSIVLIDIFILTFLYTIRIIAGGISAGIFPSLWLLIFSLFVFLSLASVKRQSELVNLLETNENKIEGRNYKLKDLNFISQIALSSGYISVVILALYINSRDVTSLYETPNILLFLCPILLFWLTRIIYKSYSGKLLKNDPVIFLLKDPMSYILGLMILTIILIADGYQIY